jgi:hypothetical protein
MLANNTPGGPYHVGVSASFPVKQLCLETFSLISPVISSFTVAIWHVILQTRAQHYEMSCVRILTIHNAVRFIRVGTVTKLSLNDLGFDSRKKYKIFLFSKKSTPALRLT